MSGNPKWPWPGDSREDKARRVALSYKHFVLQVLRGEILDPLSSLDDLDRRWAELGQNWITEQREPLRFGDWLSATEMGQLLSLPANQIRVWGIRQHIRVDISSGQNRYNVGDVVEHEAKQRAKRIKGRQ